MRVCHKGASAAPREPLGVGHILQYAPSSSEPRGTTSASFLTAPSKVTFARNIQKEAVSNFDTVPFSVTCEY